MTSPKSVRRRVPRREFKASVGVLYQGHYNVARSIQVGEGGMAINSEFAFRELDRVVLTFQIPGGSLVCVRAQVKYIHKGDPSKAVITGFEFENLEFHFKRELRNLVARATQENIVI